MTIKLEELTQQELDRLLGIEKEARCYIEETISESNNFNRIKEALKPVQKPKYKHDDFNSTHLDMFKADLHRSTALRCLSDKKHLKLTKLLLDYKDTYCPNYVWTNGEFSSYIFVNYRGKFSVGCSVNTFNPTTVYMTKKVCEQLINDIKDGVVDIELQERLSDESM